jgi:hypothetical protein
MATKGRGPSAESLREQYDHSYDHRGDSGMFGSFFIEDVDEWSPADDENEVAIVPYLVTENSQFRKLNPDLNRPVSDAALKDKEGWVYKLTALVHSNVGPNKDRAICPRTLKLPCPFCELRDQLRDELAKLKAKGRSDVNLEKRISELGASKRAIYNIIGFNSRKDRERNLMVWTAPHASIEDVIIDRARDKRTGEYKYFSVLEENWNVYFKKTGKGLNTEYSEVDLLDRRKEDRFTNEEAEKLLANAYVLDDIVEVKTYDEFYELLHGVPPGAGTTDRGASSTEERTEELRDERRSRSTREEPEERPRDRGGRGSGRTEAPLRGRERELEKASDESGKPECFALEFNQRQECEDCVSDTFKACMKASDESSKQGSPARGGEDRDGSGRSERSSRSSRK